MESSSSAIRDDLNTIQTLSKGFLELYEPPLTTINTHLKELTEKQEAVQGMISSERRKLEDLENDAMLDAMLADIATNREKLLSISNSMMTLHKRVQSLQTRAANVEKVAKSKAAISSKSQSPLPSTPSKSPTKQPDRAQPETRHTFKKEPENQPPGPSKSHNKRKCKILNKKISNNHVDLFNEIDVHRAE